MWLHWQKISRHWNKVFRHKSVTPKPWTIICTHLYQPSKLTFYQIIKTWQGFAHRSNHSYSAIKPGSLVHPKKGGRSGFSCNPVKLLHTKEEKHILMYPTLFAGTMSCWNREGPCINCLNFSVCVKCHDIMCGIKMEQREPKAWHNWAIELKFL